METGGDAESAAREFEAHRARLFAVGYRLLGSVSEAEDAVQDTYLRWNGADRAGVLVPAAWLTKVLTNLCLNRLASARARRESYVGPWLPEPVRTDRGEVLGVLETAVQRESVSLALLTLLEELTPAERAVFVLREAFGYSHREIAEILDVREEHSRQLHRRARLRVGEPRGRYAVDAAQRARIVERFFAATIAGDVAGLERLLAEDVVSWADGGGNMTAARRAIVGREKVLRYLFGLGARLEGGPIGSAPAEINGESAMLIHLGDTLAAVVVPEITDGLITCVRLILNPDKLAFVARQGA
ncbi:RNA polymerase sigma-70 factor [Embleya sp. NPDC059259]|uniref:RNA polymerase sigma-70 factor n=1 Tax=unclassified Embleya TaxID=2699296 RepID=UPI0036AB235D